MGREASEGSTTHHGVAVTGIGEAQSSDVFYSSLGLLGGANSITDLRNAVVTECAFSSNPTQCERAVLAVGVWSGDRSQGFSTPNGVELGAISLVLGGLTRFAFTVSSAGALQRRSRGCAFGGACSWSSPTTMYTIPTQTVAVTTTRAGPTLGNNLFVCFRLGTSNASAHCDRFNGTSWLIGPDPGGGVTGITGDLSIAAFNNQLFLTYVRGGTVRFRRLNLSTSTWSAEVDTGFEGVHPVLASGDEDFYTADSDDLWLVYVNNDSGAPASINHVKYVIASNSFTGVGGVVRDRYDVIFETGDQVDAAVFRGRLHVVATNALPGGPGSGNTLWYGSCAAPCEDLSGHWSNFVRQDGGSRSFVAIDNWGSWSGNLHIIHRHSASDSVYERFKLSD